MDVAETKHMRLDAVAEGMPLLADLHRGDVLLYEPLSLRSVRLVAQARPRSVPPIHPPLAAGREQPMEELPAVERVLSRGLAAAQGPRQLFAHRSHIVQRAYAIRDDAGAMVGVLALEKSLVEHERHLARRVAFQNAVEDLRDMVVRGETAGLGALSPFLETDGVLLLDVRGVITYVSGLATYHYRRLGFSEELIGRPVAQLTPADSELAQRAFEGNRPLEGEERQDDRIWRRKAIPLVGRRHPLPPLGRLFPEGVGARARRTLLMTLHDATAAHRKAEEQVVRQAMVQEIHHRVKNNLQTVASLLRIQARRAEHDETRLALAEAINRILSIAVVHEFLSQHEKRINMRDVAGRIAQQVRDGVLSPMQEIAIRVEGDPVFLHAHQTTMGALVINELILNSLEHGLAERGGEVVVTFADEGDRVRFTVADNGRGLPESFSLAESSSLGLRIVQTIVQNDLRGNFKLGPADGGTAATVTFPKAPAETFG